MTTTIQAAFEKALPNSIDRLKGLTSAPQWKKAFNAGASKTTGQYNPYDMSNPFMLSRRDPAVISKHPELTA